MPISDGHFRHNLLQHADYFAGRVYTRIVHLLTSSSVQEYVFLLSIHDCLRNIFEANLYIWRQALISRNWIRSVPWRNRTRVASRVQKTNFSSTHFDYIVWILSLVLPVRKKLEYLHYKPSDRRKQRKRILYVGKQLGHHVSGRRKYRDTCASRLAAWTQGLRFCSVNIYCCERHRSKKRMQCGRIS